MTKPFNTLQTMSTNFSETQPARSFQAVGLIGAGTMGAGITWTCAQSGYPVRLYDAAPAMAERALANIRSSLDALVEKGRWDATRRDETLSHITAQPTLEALADCDLLIEAVPEDPALKRDLFQQLDALCHPNAILASNTSSLSITRLGAATQRADRMAGLHFFNPAPRMPLVEVIRGHRTADDTLARLTHFVRSLDKTPVIAKDTPGFIVNRVARPFYGEALRMLDEHGGDPAAVRAIDAAMKAAGGFRMGPFELMDLIGIDVNLAVTQAVWQGYFQHPRYCPHPIQQRMVDAGLLGRKTGEGFYRYDT